MNQITKSKHKKKTHGEYKHQQTLTMSSYVSPVAPRMRTKMNYAVGITYAPGLPSQDYQFRLNSTFDPDLTGGGHQPLGRDQLVLLYNRYRVYSCSYRLTWSSGLYSTIIATATNNNTSLTSDINTAKELPFSKYKVFAPGGPSVEVHGHIDLAMLNGKTRQQYADDDVTQAQAGADPSELMVLHCTAHTADNSTNVTGWLDVFLTMDVEWFDALQLGSS